MGPILFNFYINDLFLFMKQATLHNYADDNTLAYFSESMPDLVKTLEKETEVALSWLENNEMIVNPEKFHCSGKIKRLLVGSQLTLMAR